MPHKIIKGSEARAAVEDFLKNEEDRTTKIETLSLEEVNVYIKTVQIMQNELEDIINTCAKFHTMQKEDEKAKSVTYMGYRFSCDWNLMPNGYYRKELDIDPQMPFKKLANLLMELEQQRDHLIQLNLSKNKLQEKINRKVSTTGEYKPKEEQEIESVMSDAQDQFALQAIDSYHALVTQTRGVFDKLKTLKNQDALLENTLSQNEKLQKDQQLLQSQLDALTRESKQNNETIANAQRQIAEQQTELAHLRQEEPLAQQIKRSDLIDLLNSFSYTSGFGLFNCNEATIDQLIKLSKANKNFVSDAEIKNCIKDKDDLEMFNHPYAHPCKSKIEMMIRDLALLFRQPQVESEYKP